MHALIILANGFEEIEAVTTIDILRRAHFSVLTAGLTSKIVTGSHHITLMTDAMLTEVKDQTFDIVILPGGEPGTSNLENSPLVSEILINQNKANRWIAAICAAPRILDKLGILNNRTATIHPAVKPQIKHGTLKDSAVVVDKKIITGRGAGVAVEFALAIIEALSSHETVNQVHSSLVL